MIILFKQLYLCKFNVHSLQIWWTISKFISRFILTATFKRISWACQQEDILRSGRLPECDALLTVQYLTLVISSVKSWYFRSQFQWSRQNYTSAPVTSYTCWKCKKPAKVNLLQIAPNLMLKTRNKLLKQK